jgi:hypothetical protein
MVVTHPVTLEIAGYKLALHTSQEQSLLQSQLLEPFSTWMTITMVTLILMKQPTVTMVEHMLPQVYRWTQAARLTIWMAT